jgi:hypothetical protein
VAAPGQTQHAVFRERVLQEQQAQVRLSLDRMQGIRIGCNMRHFWIFVEGVLTHSDRTGPDPDPSGPAAARFL